jgi:hypothetical protein
MPWRRIGECMYRSTFSWPPLVGGEWSASRPGRFTPGERAPSTHWIGGLVDPRAGLNEMEKRKFLTTPGLELRPLGHPARSQSLYRLRRTALSQDVYYCQWQIVKTSGKRKAERSFTLSVKTPKRKRERSCFERYYRNGSSPWFREIKMNSRALVSINRMKVGHPSPKTNISRFSIVSTVECDCADGLQTEERIIWDCKLCDDQRATMMDILSENSEKEYTLSITELLRLEEKKICSRRLLLHK